MKNTLTITFFFMVMTLIISPPLVQASEILVVVARNAPVENLTTKTVERIFLKRKTSWDDGTMIVPINLLAQHDLRKLFSNKILKKSQSELVEYWNEQHFKGITPPMVLESESAVKVFIRQVEGAIGYISRDALEPDLKIIFTISE